MSRAVARSAEAFGAVIQKDSPVARIQVEGGRAVGVELENGDVHRAKVVISSLDPRQTFERLTGEKHFDDLFMKRVRRYKYRGSSGKINLALDRCPNFVSRPGAGPHLRGDIAIAPSVSYLERAFDQAKYGEWSTRPYMNIVLPALVDGSVAPPGKHIMSIFVQYAPYNLKTGPESWPSRRDDWAKDVLDTLEQYVPDLRSTILHQQVLSPWDIQEDVGLTEGNIFQGELSMEQLLFLRPVPGWGRYRTPLKGLWMCGSATHPGGGVMGAPGQLAAQALLESRSV